MRFRSFQQALHTTWLAALAFAAAGSLLPGPVEAEAQAQQARSGRRDPFQPLVAQTQGGEQRRLPPGPAGLVIATLRIDGIVRSPSGMIAVVSNPQGRVYFLREGDQLYDGSVAGVSMEAVTFHEVGRDPFGKPAERVVTKRLYPSAGEQ